MHVLWSDLRVSLLAMMVLLSCNSGLNNAAAKRRRRQGPVGDTGICAVS